MSDTPDILNKIVRRKREEIAERSVRTPLVKLTESLREAGPPRGFVDALVRQLNGLEGIALAFRLKPDALKSRKRLLL